MNCNLVFFIVVVFLAINIQISEAMRHDTEETIATLFKTGATGIVTKTTDPMTKSDTRTCMYYLLSWQVFQFYFHLIFCILNNIHRNENIFNPYEIQGVCPYTEVCQRRCTDEHGGPDRTCTASCKKNNVLSRAPCHCTCIQALWIEEI